MSAGGFHLMDEIIFDNFILKKRFSEIYHQQTAIQNVFDKFFLSFVKNHNYYQIVNAYRQFEITIEKDRCHVEDDNTYVIRLVKDAFAHFFKETTIMASGRSEIEVKKYVGPGPTFMRVLSRKNGAVSSYFGNINEDNINKKSLNELLSDNNTNGAHKGKIFGPLPLEHSFGFFITYKKVRKSSSFHINRNKWFARF